MDKSPETEAAEEETPQKATEEESKEASEEEEEWVGPLPSEATEPQPKKRKVLNHEKLFLEKLVINIVFHQQFITISSLFSASPTPRLMKSHSCTAIRFLSSFVLRPTS